MRNAACKQTKYNNDEDLIQANKTFNWHLTINIEADKKDKKNNSLFNAIENRLKKLLLKTTSIVEITTVNAKHTRELHLLIDNSKIDYSKLKPEIDKIKSYSSVFFNLKEVYPQPQLEYVNKDFEAECKENTRLLKLNEKVLFSKVLKISIYKDSIDSLAQEVSNLIESTETIKPNNLFNIEKTLKSLISEEDIWYDFKTQFEKTRPDFFEKLKRTTPTLTVNELKHCTYVISKMRIKDVANLINISPRSVETARYRIKKKIGLTKEESLFSFLQSL